MSTPQWLPNCGLLLAGRHASAMGSGVNMSARLIRQSGSGNIIIPAHSRPQLAEQIERELSGARNDCTLVIMWFYMQFYSDCMQLLRFGTRRRTAHVLRPFHRPVSEHRVSPARCRKLKAWQLEIFRRQAIYGRDAHLIVSGCVASQNHVIE